MHSFTATGQECTSLHYHCTKYPDINLCESISCHERMRLVIVLCSLCIYACVAARLQALLDTLPSMPLQHTTSIGITWLTSFNLSRPAHPPLPSCRCPAAYGEGRFPAGTTARDFVRLEAREQKVRTKSGVKGIGLSSINAILIGETRQACGSEQLSHQRLHCKASKKPASFCGR